MTEVETNINSEYADRADKIGAIIGYCILGVTFSALLGYGIYAMIIYFGSMKPVSKTRSIVSNTQQWAKYPKLYQPALVSPAPVSTAPTSEDSET
jgi:hypothetical protein